MNFGLSGKSALVTGGSKGIGKAVALNLAREGVRVGIAARHGSTMADAVREIKDLTGGDVWGESTDCTKTQDVERFVSQAIDRMGRVDLLVNALGAAPAGGLLDLTDEAWEDGLALKLLGQIRCCRALVPHMQRQKWGRIVNIAGSQWKRPLGTSMVAGVANAGLVNFSKALAGTLGPDNILVNVVNPGPTETGRLEYVIERRAAHRSVPVDEVRAEFAAETMLGRFGKPEEVAHMIVFLVSELSTFVTGAVIDVDGGQNHSL